MKKKRKIILGIGKVVKFQRKSFKIWTGQRNLGMNLQEASLVLIFICLKVTKNL